MVSDQGGKVTSHLYSHRIHGTGIFAYIYQKNQPNVGTYMDGKGIIPTPQRKKGPTNLTMPIN